MKPHCHFRFVLYLMKLPHSRFLMRRFIFRAYRAVSRRQHAAARDDTQALHISHFSATIFRDGAAAAAAARR